MNNCDYSEFICMMLQLLSRNNKISAGKNNPSYGIVYKIIEHLIVHYLIRNKIIISVC